MLKLYNSLTNKKEVFKPVEEGLVKIEVPDTRKRKMILDKTGFSVDNAITVNKIVNADTEETPASSEVKRKAAPIQKQDEAPVRKSKYTVVSK